MSITPAGAPIGADSADWPGLRDWLEARIEEHRILLERPGISHDEANIERGWIASYRYILDTVSPRKKPLKGGISPTYNN